MDIKGKMFEKLEYDESFSEREIELIDKLIVSSVKKNKFGTEEDLEMFL